MSTDHEASLTNSKRWERRARVVVAALLSVLGIGTIVRHLFALTGNVEHLAFIVVGLGSCYMADLITRGCFR